MKQSITVTGLGCEPFEAAVRGIQCIYETFCLHINTLGGTLRKWTPSLDSEDLTLTFNNRYLTFAKNASQDSIINLSRTIDPFNILGPQLTNQVHTLDNVVEYWERTEAQDR